MVQESVKSSSTATASSSKSSTSSSSGSSNSNMLFPYRLQEMLTKTSAQNQDDIVSWLPDGKAFKVHKVPIFVTDILPSYFNQSKYKSFQRQLNLWGFERISKSGAPSENGGYYHPQFLRDQPALAHKLTRQKTTRNGSSLATKKKFLLQEQQHQKSRRQEYLSFLPPLLPATPATTTATAASVVVVEEIAPMFTSDDSVISTSSASVNNNDAVFMVSDDSDADSSDDCCVDTAIEFEGCTFFPLEWEYYQEMTRRVTKIMDGTAMIVKPKVITPAEAEKDDSKDMENTSAAIMADVTNEDSKQQEVKVPAASAAAANISNRKSLVELN